MGRTRITGGVPKDPCHLLEETLEQLKLSEEFVEKVPEEEEPKGPEKEKHREVPERHGSR